MIEHAAMHSAVTFGSHGRTRWNRAERRLKTNGLRWRATLALGGFAVALLAGCGGDTSSTPAATAVPAAPEPPGVAAVTLLTLPFDPGGWVVGETIRVQVTFSEPVSVSGSPRLALGIGSEIRFAGLDEEGSSGAFMAFGYHIAADDRDEDGVSIGADALELNGGTIRNGAGLDASLDLGSHVIENSAQHVVVGAPPLRECTDQQERAKTHSPVLLPKWDGTPFRVDMIRNFPDFVTEEDLVQLLAPVGLLADKIERQLGYRILEMGDVIPVPDGVPPGWNEDEAAFRRNCPLPRERGQITGFYMADTNGGAPTAGAQANPRCESFSYLSPGLGPGRWPCPGCYLDGVTLHEIFHVLGFVHDDDYDFLARGEGVAMSNPLTRGGGRDAQAVRWPDIDLLRCIFPKQE